MQSEIRSQILSFACHLDDPKVDPEQKAVERHWIDETGAPTQDGVFLSVALWDQLGTRTTYRHV